MVAELVDGYKQKNKKYLFLLFFIPFIIYGSTKLLTFIEFGDEMTSETIQVRLRYLPYSTDPFEYDDFIHHIAFSAVSSPLVSMYKKGSIEKNLVDGWAPSDDFKTWTFQIKNNCFFENGDQITAEVIGLSLTRMAYLMKIKDSKSGFLEDLNELELLKTASSRFDGIQWNTESVTLNFKKEKRDLLKKISFGLYSIVHPLDYDSVSGAWKDKKKVISSGPYKIEEWTNTNIKLGLRKVSWFSKVKKPINSINLQTSEKSENNDLIFATSYANYDENFEFLESKDQEIRYIRLFNWKNTNHPFSNKKIRQSLRTEFYKNLENINNKSFSLIRSFFPLSIRDIHENMDPSTSNNEILINNFTLRVRNSVPELVNNDKNNKLSLVNAIHVGIDATLKSLNLSFTRLDNTPKVLNMEENGNFLDMGTLTTGVLVADPDSDIRFMFLSKEGIQLPDETGEIHDLLKEHPLNIQKINELMWEQAIIWPVSHYSSGIWAKKNKFDFSELNLTLPPTNFQWIGWK